MNLATQVVIALVAALHVWFAVLEMVLWTRPLGRRTFRLGEDFATASAGLAANQGLYNLFLVAGLLWSLLAPDGRAPALFFLACVVVAGVFGALTVSRRILWVQALPAAIGLALLLLGGAR